MLLFNWIGLNWFDVASVVFTFVGVILIKLINACLQETDDNQQTTTTITATTRSSKVYSNLITTNDNIENDSTIKTIPTVDASTSATPSSPAAASASATSPPATILRKNSQLDKQASIDYENGISLSSISTPSPMSIHNTTHINQHNGFLTHTLSFDTLGDEYHEDEDTLSLENLFPCDQTEIYESKKISFIIEELIQTEENYVQNLRRGLQHYGNLQTYPNLPEPLQSVERQKQLLANIDEILELHEKQILPLMQRNQRDLKGLFDEFAGHFDKNNFYSYVSFTMGKKASMQLRQENREWFQEYQTEIKDKLGIDSFLVQPIQRLTRYPLLLQQFISEFYKSGISCKPVLTSVCKLETRMRRLLDVVNQAEEIPNIDDLTELDLQAQGHFRRATEFEAQHFPTRKKYRAKVFLFDRCLVCTEVRKRRLAYRQHYLWEYLELQRPISSSPTATINNKSIMLLVKGDKGAKREEYAFVASEAAVVKQWLQATHKIIESARYEYSQRGKFSLPMDLVLGVGFAIWLIWRYL